MNSRSVAVLFVFFASIFACCAFGQTFRGSIQGTVTDPSGAAIVGAKVKVFSTATGFSRTVTTNEQGEYQTSELPLGTYSITIEVEGFRTTTLNQIPVSVGSPARADAKLITGQVKELVEVNAEVPLVETTSNTTGGTIEAAQMAELPINGRDFTKLLELVPGTTSDPVGSTESAGSYGLFSLNGNRGRSNNYLLDGTDMNDGYRNLPSINQAGVWGCPSTILPVDALAEVPVTGNPEAEFGRSSGATVNIVTKSGSNKIHGSAFEYFRNDALGARNYFNSTVLGTTLPKNSFSNNQYGGSAGGPIVKDRSFWFAAYEGQRENGGLPQVGFIPTQSYINAFGLGNVNPVISKLLARNPWGALPTLADTTIDQVQTTFTTPFVNNSDNLIFKIDQHLHLFSSGDLLTGRYFFSHGTQSFPLGMLNTGSSAPGFNTSTPTHVNIVSLSYTSVPRSNLIFELRGGYNRFLQDFFPQDITFDPTSIGLNTLPPDAIASRDFGLPTISISGGYSPIGTTGSDARGRIDTNYQLFGNVSLNKGRHSYKAGYEWRRTFINSFIDSGHRGKLSFNSLDDFLAGNIHSGGSATGLGTRYTYQNNSGAYMQDSWRLSNRITLNYGIRWDYFGVVGAKDNAFGLFDVKSASVVTVGTPGAPSSLYPKDWNNFAPRVSVVDDLMGNGKLVLRSGAGIFYDGASQDFFVGNQPWNTSAAQAGPAFNTIGFSTTVASKIDSSTQIFGGYQPNSAFTVAQNLATPIYFSYNLNMESQVTRKAAVQVGYVGSEGHHLFRFRDLNQFNNVLGRTVSCGNGTTIGYLQQCFPAYYYVNQEETTANSNYNSLQASLKLQNWNGFTSTLNYTWAHSIDNASDGLDFVPNAAQPDDSFNVRAERANSNFDVRNRIQWYFTYNVPNMNRAKWISNGWAVDGMFNHATGQPFTLSYLYESDSNGADLNGSGEFFGRPDIVGNPYAGTHGPSQFLNLAAFAVPCTLDNTGACEPNTQHPGNEGRNAFRASSYNNFDLSLTKLTHLNERVAIQLRADFFNVLNHPNFSNPLLPGFSVDFLNGTSPTSANRLGSGYLPLTATPDVGSGNPYLGGGGPRTMQLAAHLTF